MSETQLESLILVVSSAPATLLKALKQKLKDEVLEKPVATSKTA